MADIQDYTVGAVEGQEHAEAEQYRKEYEMDKNRERNNKALNAQIAKSDGAWIKANAKRAEAAIKERQKAESEAEDAMKKTIMYQINLYLTRFPILAETIPKIGPKSSLGELSEALGLIRAEMNAQMAIPRLKSYVDQFFLGLETLWGDGTGPLACVLPPPMRLNLKGIYVREASGGFNDKLMPLLAEIDIEYPWLGRMQLPWRVIEAVSGIMLSVHIDNVNPTARKIRTMGENQPVEMTEDDLPDDE